MSDLTKDDIEELKALQETNDALKRRTFLSRAAWRDGYAKLVRGGYVRWCDPPPGFDKKRFAGAIILAKGRAAVRAAFL